MHFEHIYYGIGIKLCGRYNRKIYDQIGREFGHKMDVMFALWLNIYISDLNNNSICISDGQHFWSIRPINNSFTKNKLKPLFRINHNIDHLIINDLKLKINDVIKQYCIEIGQ